MMRILFLFLLMSITNSSLMAQVYSITVGQGRGTEITIDIARGGYGSSATEERNRRIAQENQREAARVAEVNRNIAEENQRHINAIRARSGEAAAKAEALRIENERRKEEGARQAKYAKEYYTFKTPWQSRHYQKLNAAREREIKAIEYLNGNPTMPHIEARQALLATADVLIAAADEYYASKDNENGDQTIKLANQCLDTVYDFLPGVSLVKDVLSLTTGVNPITGEKLTEVDKAIIASSIFLPTVVSGTIKRVSTTAKILQRVIKNSTAKLRSSNATTILNIIKDCDQYFFTTIDRPESIKPLLQTIGELTDKIIESAAKLGIKNNQEINNFIGFSKRMLSNEIGAVGDIEKITEKLKGAKGKTGKEFEDHIASSFGGQGSFNVGGREFDGAIKNVWYEAKSGNYWTSDYGGKGFAKFKSDMGDRLRIAAENSKEYQLISNTPISTEAKEWLTQKGINYLEILE